MNDVLLSPIRLSDLESLIEKSLRRVLNESPSSVPDEVGGIKLAQAVTRLSSARIYTLVSERKIPHSKRGNRLTFSRSSLIKWLNEGNREVKEEVANA